MERQRIKNRSRFSIYKWLMPCLLFAAIALLLWRHGIQPEPDDSPQSAPIPSASSLRELDIEQYDTFAAAAGLKMIDAPPVVQVARHFADTRWQGLTPGTMLPVFAPDGLPEAHFVIMRRGDAQPVAIEELADELNAMREERLAAEALLESAPPEERPGLLEQIHDIWQQMQQGDAYATVVVGANDGREPFIASFAGLPPQLLMWEDAREMRRRQLDGADPGQPQVMWLPPLFIVYAFPAHSDKEPAFFEINGAVLSELPLLANWVREHLDAETLAARRQRWREFTEDQGG